MRTGFVLPRVGLRLAAFFLMILALVFSFTPSLANFSSPTIDGTINTGEYGSHLDGQNQQTTPTNQTWYMTWDATNLYLGLSGANTSEAAVIYLDKNPIAPVNGGTNADGTLSGFGYDNANFAALPFRADAVFYFKNGYNEYRTADGNNGWSNPVPIGGSYASNNGTNTREIAIPWSTIGGLPTAFNWFGYVTSGSGYLYGSVPTANPTGSVGPSARPEHYYTVNNTANTASAILPFAHDSYTFNQAGDLNGVGALNVYDFTMNSPGQKLTRDTGQWNVAGNFGVYGGTVDFGSTTSPTVIAGDLNLGAGGSLSLSTASAGTVALSGNLYNNGATFTANSPVFTFAGNHNQVITGTTSTAFNQLNLNMGTSQTNVLDVQSPITLSDGGLSLSNGTFKLSSASVITPFVAAPTITTTAGFWLNSPSTIEADYNWTLNGLLRISAGRLNITSPSNQYNIRYGNGANFQLDGGELNLSGGIIRLPPRTALTMSRPAACLPWILSI